MPANRIDNVPPSPQKSAATRNDVARLAGVSSAVVSYVINGSKHVSPATEARVRDAIAKLDYRPNAAARALRLGSSEMLGMIMPSTTNPYFAELSHEVELAAGKRGFALLTANSDASVRAERRHLESFASRRIDGVFLCSNLHEPDMRDLEAAGIPVVLLNHLTVNPTHDSVGVDLRGGARLAVEHLVEHGHDDIGLIMGTHTGGEIDAREVGWTETMERLDLVPGPVVRRPFTPPGGYDALQWLLRSQALPRALFVGSDQMARGVVKAAHEAGLRMPEDLAIVSFDGSLDAEYTWPTLTTVAQPLATMAEAAVGMLLGDSHEHRHEMLPPTLVRRASCGC
jgi:LacI family transcriptional regulator